MKGTISQAATILLWGACCAALGMFLGWPWVLGLLIGSVIIAILTYEGE